MNELEGLTRLTTTGVLWLEGLAGWPGGRCRPPATEPVEIMESRLDAEELPILFFHCEYKLKNRKKITQKWEKIEVYACRNSTTNNKQGQYYYKTE